ncbi:hypothetical protein TGRUB_268170 [Toxoplasma gondii RUB]|uniref:Uncharacterized protein n=5 Tax=Toxoplasma gondii TaxID=5811 RepID=A0A086LXK2_TOXGO|nr:hypothetical protein TGDOM2_268170 [Toxoplasma gondii GAB2-2007-GAL-DOM2]KFG54617.1 hypothetical protein TGFOU_268170 [Toxoplasma gondii FOU]KFG61370.1 hypothetical protein TGRUB_268170 [Toxoplasma gondii RUB]KFH06299.1 hypothetical protein TGVAND_268170 [Toxoplasma gondii VAND]RQX75040.1 hypothetical protein TGCAST_268170 [Toxoplasma gondii CAST]
MLRAASSLFGSEPLRRKAGGHAREEGPSPSPPRGSASAQAMSSSLCISVSLPASSSSQLRSPPPSTSSPSVLFPSAVCRHSFDTGDAFRP